MAFFLNKKIETSDSMCFDRDWHILPFEKTWQTARNVEWDSARWEGWASFGVWKKRWSPQEKRNGALADVFLVA